MWLHRRFGEIGKIERASRHYGAGILSAAWRFARLNLLDKFSAEEVFLLGLLDPRMNGTDLGNYISKENLLAVQNRLNPAEHFSLTEDKVEFYRKCSESGLATPEVLAIFCHGERGVPGFATLRNEHDLLQFLDTCDTLEFIIKPATGVHGQGIRLLLWNSGELREDGQRSDPAQILSDLTASDFSVWIIQPALKSHAALARLSGTDRLQTARVVTYIDGNGKVHIPIAYLRIIAGGSTFDNFNFGTSGNLVGTIDIDTGRLKHVLGAQSHGFGLSQCECHPLTGQPFSTFAVPHIGEISTLVRKAGRAFLPLRTIGWDVAITDDGPSLIEGNVTWDPLPTQDNMNAVVRSLI